MEQRESTQFELMVVGVGGQGVLTVAKLLAEAGMLNGKHALYFPNYGPAKRGGECECTVILSEKEISSPVTLYPGALIVMDNTALKQYGNRVRPGGLVILDSSVITERVSRDDLKAYYIPATKAALDLGNSQVANLVLLGAYLEATKAATCELVETALDKMLAGGRREDLLTLNRQALKEGIRLVADHKG